MLAVNHDPARRMRPQTLTCMVVQTFLTFGAAMRTVSDLLALTGATLSSNAAARKDDEQTAKAEKTTFADLGGRIGEDNEVLRNLLIDTSHQLSTIDELKESFNKLVEPLGNVLTKLEQE